MPAKRQRRIECRAGGVTAASAAPSLAAGPTSPSCPLPSFRLPSDQLASLTAWLPTVGITVEPVIALTASVAAGIGVRAVADLKPGTLLGTIPRTAILSCSSAAVAPVLASARLGGGLGLAVALAAEAAAGPASRWGGYMASLPSPGEALPITWPPSALAAAAGSDLPARAAADAAAVAEDFEENVVPLIPSLVDALVAAYGPHPALPPPADLSAALASPPLFVAATTWVASRSFGVDAAIGRGMVPLADAFNHKDAVVEVGAGWAVERVCFADSEGEEGSDGEEGEEGGGAPSPSPSPSPPSEGEGEGAADADDPWACLAAPPRADGLFLELAICGATTLPGSGPLLETLECRAAAAIPAGAEVHNTYGEHGATDLAARYGFASAAPCPGPFDAVALRVEALRAAALATLALSPRALRARTRLLAPTDLLDGNEPLELLPGGVVGPALRVVLRVLGASQAELAGWARLEDACGAGPRPLGPLPLAGAASADPPLTPQAARLLGAVVEARLGEYPAREDADADAGVDAAAAAVAAAAAGLEKAAASASAGPTTAAALRAGEALRAARATLTARLVVRTEMEVLKQAAAGAAAVEREGA